jgi:hypothetical protein
MFDVGQTPEAVRAESPTLDDELLTRIMVAVEQATVDSRWEVFSDTPSPHDAHPTGEGGLADSVLLFSCCSVSDSRSIVPLSLLCR